MAEGKNVSRRRFLNYAGTAVVAGVVAGAGGYYAGLSAAPPPTGVPTTVTTTVTAPPVTVTATAPTTKLPPLKIAAVSAEPRDDNGWGYQAWSALTKANEQYGAEIHMTEGIVAPADALRVATDYADKGYNIIFGNGFHLGEPWHKDGLPGRYPDKAFLWTCVELGDANAYSMVYQEEEDGFMQGVASGFLTKTGTVGVMGGMLGPCTNSFINGFTIGAKAVKPNVKVLTGAVGSWIDPAKGKDMANSMVDEGADNIGHYTGYTGLGVFEVSESRKIYSYGTFTDQASFAPNTIVFSCHFNHWKGLKRVIEDYIAGTVKGELMYAGYETGYFWNVPNPKVWDTLPDDVKSKLTTMETLVSARAAVVARIKVPRVTEVVPQEQLPTLKLPI